MWRMHGIFSLKHFKAFWDLLPWMAVSTHPHWCSFPHPYPMSSLRNRSTWPCVCAAHTLGCTSGGRHNSPRFHRFYCLFWAGVLLGRNRQFLFQEPQNSGCYSLHCSASIHLSRDRCSQSHCFSHSILLTDWILYIWS